GARAHRGIFRRRRLESFRPVDSESRYPLHPEFSLDGSEQSGRGIQPEHANARFPSYGARFGVLRLRAARGPRLSSKRLDSRALGLWHGLVRTNRHYDAIYAAAV